MYHALALFGVAWAAPQWPTGAVRAAGWLFVDGTAVFSGSQRWLGAITPIGRLLFLAGWIALAIGIWRG